MTKVTIKETVSKSVSVDTSFSDVCNALTRCFQFLEEGRFEEAHVIVEQILNIDPHNTDAHVANFLYHFRLNDVTNVAEKFQRADEYKNSVFYARIVNSQPTELGQEFNFWINKAETRQNEDKRIQKERRLKDIQELEYAENSFRKKWIVSIISASGMFVFVLVLGFLRSFFDYNRKVEIIIEDFQVFFACGFYGLVPVIAYFIIRQIVCCRKRKLLESEVKTNIFKN